MAKALIVVDVQNDFCEGGSLAVEGGAQVAADVTEFIKKHRDEFPVIVATRDWHISPGNHFASTVGGAPNFGVGGEATWPDHCVAGSEGAEYHQNLQLPPETVHFKKGEHAGAYSGFEANVHDPFNDEQVSLDAYLKACDVDEVEVVGIATDYCVKATVLDALSNGYKVKLHVGLTAAVDPNGSGTVALSEMELEGATIVHDQPQE